MATFIGFNTQNQYGKFTLLDFELIKRDLANAFNIQQGQLPGRPEVGTVIWSLVFENQSAETQNAILAEVQRVIALDPRIVLTQANIYPQENGLLIEIQIQTIPGQTAQFLQLFFDQQNNIATVS
jgi:phage baseplate assembly protein W